MDKLEQKQTVCSHTFPANKEHQPADYMCYINKDMSRYLVYLKFSSFACHRQLKASSSGAV